MENASKALIIAGAILISIVLITLGVVILQQGDSMTGTGETALNAREIESFNSQFTKYAGASVSGTNVRALINAATASNAAQGNSGSNHTVTVHMDGETAMASATDVLPAQKYEVTVESYDNGYVSAMNVK